MSTKNSAAQQPELIEVVLAKAHIHKRKPCVAGDTIKVTAVQKAWLEKQGIVGGQQEEVSNG